MALGLSEEELTELLEQVRDRMVGTYKSRMAEIRETRAPDQADVLSHGIGEVASAALTALREVVLANNRRLEQQLKAAGISLDD